MDYTGIDKGYVSDKFYQSTGVLQPDLTPVSYTHLDVYKRQEQQSRQTGRLEKQAQHKKNIADKRMELQKAHEARQAQRKADGSATTGATRRCV